MRVRVMCMRMCRHMFTCMRVHVHVHARVRACMHACMHACVHACMRACVRASSECMLTGPGRGGQGHRFQGLGQTLAGRADQIMVTGFGAMMVRSRLMRVYACERMFTCMCMHVMCMSMPVSVHVQVRAFVRACMRACVIVRGC